MIRKHVIYLYVSQWALGAAYAKLKAKRLIGLTWQNSPPQPRKISENSQQRKEGKAPYNEYQEYMPIPGAVTFIVGRAHFLFSPPGRLCGTGPSDRAKFSRSRVSFANSRPPASGDERRLRKSMCSQMHEPTFEPQRVRLLRVTF